MPGVGQDASRVRIVCLSPHPDDVALSVTNTLNLISAQHPDARVDLVTCFSQAQYTAYPDRYGGQDVAEVRQGEDLAYLAAIAPRNGHLVSLGLLDAPHRPEWSGKPGAHEVAGAAFGEIETYTRELVRRASGKAQQGALILSPVGIGHKDHRITSEAALRLWPSRPLLFYEDAPYVLNLSERALRARVRNLAARVGSKLRPIRLRGAFDLEAWLRCVGVYRSQFLEDDIRPLGRVLRARSGERLWANAEALEWLATRGLAVWRRRPSLQPATTAPGR